MSDCLVFALPVRRRTGCWAAALRRGRPGADLFELPLVAVNTALLLLSSITYGFAMLEMEKANLARRWAGSPSPACSAPGFIGIEIYQLRT